MLTTVPIVLVGSMAVAGLNLTGALDVEATTPSPKPKSETADLSTAVKAAFAEARKSSAAIEAEDAGTLSVAAAPSTYRVEGGDTISGIAGRFGLSTASVLALNGLGWKTVIFPGQVLKLTNAVASTTAPLASTAAPASSARYTIAKGDTVSSIASRFGVSVSTILSANGLSATSVIYAGRTLAIPSGSAPAPAAAAPTVTNAVTAAPTSSGSSYTIAKGDTISSIAKRFGVSIAAMLSANGLSASSVIYAGRTLSVPSGSASAAAPAPAVTNAVDVTPTASGSSYTIASGDTISAIATKFGVGTKALLEANGLTLSSIIFSGQKLTIPGAPSIVAASSSSSSTYLSPEMKANATTIVRVGQRLGVPDYGIVIALAAAMQESSLRNIDYGDRDSIGLFQQRPSTGWGTKAQLLDPDYASRLFYGGSSNPNRGVTVGLLEISGWESLSVTDAAQKVQISAFPDAYAKWETSARAWFQELK
jgi:LysM repeat protein